jgi:hypothetical protein
MDDSMRFHFYFYALWAIGAQEAIRCMTQSTSNVSEVIIFLVGV